MKHYFLIFAFSTIAFITLLFIPLKRVSACEAPSYIKFDATTTAFDESHAPPGTCSEINQNGAYTAIARHQLTNPQEGTSSGTYKRSVSINGEWQSFVTKSFPVKCPQTIVTWDGDNETTWQISYTFTTYPNHAISYQAKFTTTVAQQEGLSLVGSHTSTPTDSASAVQVVTWITSSPEPPNIPDGEYRAWKVGDEYKLFKKIDGEWIWQDDLPKP